MKNEPIIAYNHLQEEQEEQLHSEMPHHEAKSNKGWRMMMNPVAIAIEIAAIIAMAIFMIAEMFH